MTSSDFIRENFNTNDRLAAVVLNKKTHEVIQRLASADSMAAPDFQSWLRYKNNEGFEVYLSLNALHDSAEGRTKAEIAAIRHIFLDFDDDGTAAVERLEKRDDMPTPSYISNTSPNRWQAIWKVEGFDIEQAEILQKALARQTSADIAAADCARVLRLPGFYNHKYAERYWVGFQKLSEEIYSSERFRRVAADQLAVHTAYSQRPRTGTLTQSEKDWAFARRSLARGDKPQDVAGAIATYRRYDKANPQYYAELTVRKASESLSLERIAERPSFNERTR